jgi:isopenicillin N synthase-like dioxygenase
MSAFDHLPVLDLDEAHNPRTKPQFMNALLDAVVNVGFFYLKNTIPASIEDEMVQKSIELLNLPLQEKTKLEMANSKHFLGYTRLFDETTAGVADSREQFDVGGDC